MECVASAISAYHRILDRSPYRDLKWAEALQASMRQHRIADSGRLLCPALRPCLLSAAQAASLAASSAALARLLRRLEPIIAGSPQLLSRIRMLPGEKMLASLPCEASFITRPVASVANEVVCVNAFQSSAATGLAFPTLLADLFLSQQLTADFAKDGFGLRKPFCCCGLAPALLKHLRAGNRAARPHIAILDLHTASGSRAESDLLVRILTSAGLCARVVMPDQLDVCGNRLVAAGVAIDAVLRRVSTTALLTACDNCHPLWTAYRDRLAIFVNGFRSDLWQYPAALELLTDTEAWQNFSPCELDLVSNRVSWTRLVYNRKTTYRGAPIDLIPFLRHNRAAFTLRPNDPASDARIHIGSRLSAADWDRALKLAETAPHVAQSSVPSPPEVFPVLRYSTHTRESLSPSICCNTVDGSLESAMAFLYGNAGQQVAIAPVLSVQRML